MKYIELRTLEGRLVGAVTTNDLFYYEPKSDKMLHCGLDKAQYVLYKDTFYHPVDCVDENPTKRQDKITKVIASFISEEEYEKKK